MANSPSARKRIRQTVKRTARHGARRSRARRFVRFCEEAMSTYAAKDASSNPSAQEVKDRVKDRVKDKTKDKKAGKSSSKSGGALDSASLPLDEHFRRAMAELHRAAQKGALHRKAVARKVSRLAKRLKTLTQGESEAEGRGGGVDKKRGSLSRSAPRA